MSEDEAVVITVLPHVADKVNDDGEELDPDATSSYSSSTVNDYSNYNSSFCCSNSSQIPDQLFQEELQKTVFTYALPVIIILGTIGNTLSFLVLVRCQMRTTSVYYYLMTLAVADTCVLYVSAFKTWIRVLFDYELLHTSAVSCRLITFLFLVSLHLSAWLIVLVTIDRFVVVWFPFKASSMCTVTRARLATAVMVTVTVVSQCHVFWTYELRFEREMNRYVCGPIEQSSFMTYGFEYLKLATYSLIPFVIILVLNLAIITRLQWKPLLLRARSGGTSSTFSGGERCEPSTAGCGRQTKVTYMLVVVSLAWLVLTFPVALHYLLPSFWSTKEMSWYRGMAFLFMYTNHAINFYLYCISGRKFRRELEELSRGICPRTRQNGSSTACSPSRKTHATRTNLVDIEMHDLVHT